MKVFRFVKSITGQLSDIESYGSNLWVVMLFWLFGVTVAMKSFGPLGEVLFLSVAVPMAIWMAIGIVGTILDALAALIYRRECKAEEEIERQFVTMIEPAINALPPDHQKDFRERMLESMKYYSEGLTLAEKIKARLTKEKQQ